MKALRAGRLSISIVVAILVVGGGVALGATGALTPQGCIADVGDAAGCGATQQGLDGAVSVAISPDGTSLYAVGAGDDSIVRFDRDTTTGALTPRGCIADVGDAAGCGATQQGLDGPRDVAVSADGKSVYVAGESDKAVVRFDRDTATGALTPQGCIADVGVAGCGATQQGLYSAFGVAVSADGKSVYVVGRSDLAIVRFDRATTGALTGQGCIADPPNFAGCGAAQQGMDAVNDVAVSADGKSVYVTSDADHAIVRFDRSPAGALTPQGCIADVGDIAGCGATQQGLQGAFGVALSADGKSAYVAATDDAAIVRFDRDATGVLTGQGCIADVGDAAGCGATQQGLSGARGVALSADGISAYVASAGDDAIVRFDRDAASGALTGQGCVADIGDVATCGATQQGLNSANGVAAADGSAYVASVTDDAVVRFDRELATPPPPPSSAFTVGKVKGLRVALTTPGPGQLEIRDANSTEGKAGKKLLLKPSSATAGAAGTVGVTLRLTKAAKKKLRQRRRVRVRAAITFTPVGGTANTMTKKLKIKK